MESFLLYWWVEQVAGPAPPPSQQQESRAEHHMPADSNDRCTVIYLAMSPLQVSSPLSLSLSPPSSCRCLVAAENPEHEMIIIIFYNFSFKFPISLNSNSSNKMFRITTAWNTSQWIGAPTGSHTSPLAQAHPPKPHTHNGSAMRKVSWAHESTAYSVCLGFVADFAGGLRWVLIWQRRDTSSDAQYSPFA